MTCARAWLAGLLLVGIAGCGESSTPPPRLPSGIAERLQPGDVLRVATPGSALLDETITLQADGRAAVPACGIVVLAGQTTKEVGAQVGACLVAGGMFGEPPPISITILKRGMPPVVVVGPAKKRREVPYEPGMTLVMTLGEALATRELPDQVVLHRRGGRYTINLEAILLGKAADEPIERADEIVIEENLPIRPPRLEMVPIGGEPKKEPALETNATCGELLLEEAGLLALGKGERHPDRVRILEARKGRCDDAKTAASLGDACLRAREKRAQMKLDGYGPAHPAVRAIEAGLAICPPP